MNKLKCPYCHEIHGKFESGFYRCYFCNNEYKIDSKGRLKIKKLTFKSILKIFYYTFFVPTFFLIAFILTYYNLQNYHKEEWVWILTLSILGVVHPLIFFLNDPLYQQIPESKLVNLYFRFFKKRTISDFKIPDKFHFMSSFLVFCVGILMVAITLAQQIIKQ